MFHPLAGPGPPMTAPSRPGYATVPSQFPIQPLAGILGGSSEAGRKSRNDDAIAGCMPLRDYDRHTRGIVACIADGITTGRNSHLAAQLAVTQFTRDWFEVPESWAVQDCAARLISALNGWLFAQNRSGSPDAEGQVTTFTAIVARSTTAHIVHIGDTRCLRLRAGRIACLTEDHVARFTGGDGALTRALGIEADIRVDYLQDAMEEDDVYLLVSDGVHGVLDEAEIAHALVGRSLADRSELESAARTVCDMALAAGSGDNLSCLLLRITHLPSETPTEAHRRLTDRVIPPAMEPGNRIDGFEVERVLHSTARSHVYLVREAGEETRRVLKAPSRNFVEDTRYLEGFTLEQWVGRRIDNPQVMKILPHRDSRFLYYVAEWIEGETLREWMRRNPDPGIAEVHTVLSSLVSAVRVFHRMGMVHRDLKPENIILSDDGVARIIDFGSVRVSGFADLATGSGADLPEGTLNYIAPEVLMGRGVSNRSDIYSLGAMAFEMLAGRVPLDLERRAVLPKSAEEWKFHTLGDLRPDLPAATGRALARALSYGPQDRPAVMTEFLGDLHASQIRRAGPNGFVPLLQRGSVGFWRGWAMASTVIAGASLIMLIVIMATNF